MSRTGLVGYSTLEKPSPKAKARTHSWVEIPKIWAMGTMSGMSMNALAEPEEIKKFVEATGGAAKTLLIRGGARMTKSNYGNASDDCVENYEYDYYFTNDKSLEEAERDFVELLKSAIG